MTLVRLVPSLAQRSKMKRQQIIDNFEEVCLEINTLIEVEGNPPKYLWLLLEGEFDIYKKPESLFDKNKATDSSKLNLWSNPKDSGNLQIGCKVGIIKNFNLVCEDSLFFRQPLIYSIRCKTNVTAWRY